MFSNRYRWFVLPLVVGYLLALEGWWTWVYFEGKTGYSQMLRHPEQLDGQDVVLSLFRVSEVVDADHYRVEKGALRLGVVGPTADVEVGTEIYTGGPFDAARGEVTQAWFDARPLRPWKKRLGYVGLVLTAFILYSGLRRTERGLEVLG